MPTLSPVREVQGLVGTKRLYSSRSVDSGRARGLGEVVRLEW